MVDIDMASTDDLIVELKKRQEKYENYSVKYWRVSAKNITMPYEPEYVIASDEYDAIRKLEKFFEKKYDATVELTATLLSEADFSEVVVEAKTKYEELESLRSQFKKANDL